MHKSGYVLANKGVQNAKCMVFACIQRTHCWRQEWNDRIHERDRYSVNRIFKLEHSLEPVYIYVMEWSGQRTRHRQRSQ